MLNDIANNLFETLVDYKNNNIPYHELEDKIKLEMARYAVAALLDSRIALEAEQELAKENYGRSL